MSSNLAEALNCASPSQLLGLCAHVKWLLTSHCLNSLFYSYLAAKMTQIEYIFACHQRLLSRSRSAEIARLMCVCVAVVMCTSALNFHFIQNDSKNMSVATRVLWSGLFQPGWMREG